MGLANHRYEISCSYCGVISYAGTLAEALRDAQHAATRHNGANESVKVFNVMAHWNAPELWDITGKVLQHRTMTPSYR